MWSKTDLGGTIKNRNSGLVSVRKVWWWGDIIGGVIVENRSAVQTPQGGVPSVQNRYPSSLCCGEAGEGHPL